MRRLMVGIAIITCAMASVAIASPAYDASADVSSASPQRLQDRVLNGTCRDFSLPVSLTEDGPRNQKILGTTCTPAKATISNEIQIVVPGATYNRWFAHPTGTDAKSYLESALSAGRNVILYDRIGTGRSSRPDPSQVTIDAGAVSLHQLVQAAKKGTVSDRPFQKVLVVAHSLGSVVAIREAAHYRDVTGVAATGYSHEIKDSANDFLAAYHNANLEAGRFRNLPDGYITTKPGTRALMYDLRTATQNTIDADEATKDTTTTGEQSTTGDAVNDSLSVSGIPILLAVGETDMIFCGEACAQDEATYYPRAQCVQLASLPRTGHDIFTSTTSPDLFGVLNQWSDPKSDRCAPKQSGSLHTIPLSTR